MKPWIKIPRQETPYLCHREVCLARTSRWIRRGADRDEAQGKHTPTVRKILASQKTFGNHLDDFLALQAQNEVNINPSAAHKRPNLSKKVEDDIPMPDAVFSEPILPPASRPPYPEHPGDNDPQLKSRIPELPTDAELRALLAAPPLSYVEARGEFEDEEWKKRRRVFCDVCGYWGRVRCTRCGSRVCALECLELHREECITRYGM